MTNEVLLGLAKYFLNFRLYFFKNLHLLIQIMLKKIMFTAKITTAIIFV